MMRRKLVAPTAKAVKLEPIRANAGIEAAYRKRLQALITEMSRSVIYWTRAAWKKDDPLLAQDRARHRAPILDLRRNWQKCSSTVQRSTPTWQ
jgi:hypothetical protein